VSGDTSDHTAASEAYLHTCRAGVRGLPYYSLAVETDMNIIEPIDPQLLGGLSAETAVTRFRELLYCEARYVGLKPDAITISANLYVPDGGVDAQVELTGSLPPDTFFNLIMFLPQPHSAKSF
jgi:hypothetical protein